MYYILVNFAGHISLYGPLNLKVSLLARLINLIDIINNLVLSVRTVSYGSSFFRVDLWPKREINGKNSVRNLKVRTLNSVSKRCFFCFTFLNVVITSYLVTVL